MEQVHDVGGHRPRLRPARLPGRLWRRARRRRELARQVPAALDAIAAAVQAGAALRPAVQATVLQLRDPLRSTLAPLLELQQVPALEQSLLELCRQIGGDEMTLLAHAVTVAAQSAQPQPAALVRLARRLRARQTAEQSVGSHVARARRLAGAAAVLLVAVPAGVLCLEPAAVRALLSRPVGWLAIILPALLVCRGLALLVHAADVDMAEP